MQLYLLEEKSNIHPDASFDVVGVFDGIEISRRLHGCQMHYISEFCSHYLSPNKNTQFRCVPLVLNETSPWLVDK